MKIFYQYSSAKKMTPTRGDFISELNILKAISRFADITINERDKCDLYYVRSNPRLFKILSHPKIYFASPYNKICFRQADAIATFSKEWTKRLKQGIPNTAGCSTKISKPIITLQQVIDDKMFFPRQSKPRTKKIRKTFDGEFVIGHFGKMRPTNFPHTFLKILPRLKKLYPGLKVVFSDLSGINAKGIMRYKVPYHFIPNTLSACDLLLFPYWSAAGRYSGALRIKEAMACGVPIITAKFEARVEELGEDYPYYTKIFGKKHSTIEAQDDMFEVISRAIDDDKLREDTADKIYQRSKKYFIDPSTKRIEKDFRQVIDQCH